MQEGCGRSDEDDSDDGEMRWRRMCLCMFVCALMEENVKFPNFVFGMKSF